MRNVLLLLIFIIHTIAFAQQPEELFQSANDLYQNKEYKAAADLYEQIVEIGYYAPAVYYNLGLSYYKSNEIGPAIYNLEKAKKLAPGNEEIQVALRVARLKTSNTEAGYEEGVLQQWWNRIITLFSADGWGTIALVCIWLAFALGVAFLFTRNTVLKRISFFSILFLVIFAGTSLYFAFEYQKRLDAGNVAVVYNDVVKVKAEPDASSGDLFVLYEGAKMNIIERQGEWIKIRYNDSKTGWISHLNIRFI